MRQSVIVSIAMWLIIVVSSTLHAADLTGTWVGSTETDRGTDRLTLVLAKASGGYSGTMTDSLGLFQRDTPIGGVKLDGDVLAFAVAAANMVNAVAITLRFQGDKAAGEWVTDGGRKGTLVLEKLKSAMITSPVLTADLTGSWLGVTDTGRGMDQLTLVLKKGPQGYGGTLSDSLSIIAKDAAIRDVKQDGNVLRFRVNSADGAHYVIISLQFEGDKATGEWVTDEGNRGGLAFDKQKK